MAEIGLTRESFPQSNRPMCRACLDWSQRRHHLADQIGKGMLDRMIGLGWARRSPASRIIRFTPEGERLFEQWLRKWNVAFVPEAGPSEGDPAAC